MRSDAPCAMHEPVLLEMKVLAWTDNYQSISGRIWNEYVLVMHRSQDLLRIKLGKPNSQLPSTAPLRHSVNLTHLVMLFFFFWGFKKYIDPTENRQTPAAQVGYRYAARRSPSV